jgi:hypothetical protein
VIVIKKIILILFFALCNFHLSVAQELDSLSNFSEIEILKPSIVSTHSFGIFFSRWQGNFKSHPSKGVLINFNLESGNVWSPPVTAYIPNNQIDREYISQFDWHSREFKIDVSTLDSKTLEVQNDGVIKGLRANVNFSLTKRSELKIGMRAFLLTKGKLPFSIFTSDESIEFFHDNIAGGDDPFDRKLYPFNEAKIRYKDRNDRVLNFENGDFSLSGFEFSYYYYPHNFLNQTKRLYMNFGSHLGLNTSKYNNSIDLGITANLMKQYELKNNKNISLGLSIGSSRNSAINFKDSNIEFASNKFIGYLESIAEFSYVSKKKTKHSFGIDFYIQTSLNKKSEFDYLIPTKNGVSFKSWNSGTSNLYKNNNYWTLMYSFEKKITTTFYLQQDLTVNNNPDLQTGINVTFNL